MAHPASSRIGSTFVYDAGTTQERVVTQTAVPLERLKLTSADPQELVRVFNTFADQMHKATLPSRSLPNVVVVVLVAIAFTNGQSVTLAHRLGTASVAVELLDKSVATSGVAEAGWTAKDDTNVTLLPAGTFTADVRFTLKP